MKQQTKTGVKQMTIENQVIVTAYGLTDDGRDTDRIVDVFGNELSLTHCVDGQLSVSMADGEHLDYFTQSEWDMIVECGTVRPLDIAAGTNVTTVNW